MTQSSATPSRYTSKTCSKAHGKVITFLNVALLLIATGATLAAFGGDTWDKEKKDHPLHRRVKLRGWMSLLCLGGALFLGILKEFELKAKDQLKDDATANERIADKAAADVNEKSLTDRLVESQKNLAATREDLGKVLDALTSNQKSLTKVQKNLDSTRIDLAKETSANLVNLLAATQGQVAEIWVFIPIKPAIKTKAALIKALLPIHNNRRCDYSSWSISDDLRFNSGDVISEEGYGTPIGSNINSNEGLIDEKQLSENNGIRVIRRFLSHQDEKGIVWVKRLRPQSGDRLSAANLLTSLGLHESPFYFSIYTEGCEGLTPGMRELAFDSALLSLVLDKSRNETVSYVIDATKEQYNRITGNFEVHFTPASGPHFMAFQFRDVTHGIEKWLDTAPETVLRNPSETYYPAH